MKLIFILPLLMIPVESGPGVKLKGGSNPSEGNVFVDGKPVCDDDWDDNDAGVVCRMLGYMGGEATPNSATESKFGSVPSALTDWSMDDVQCSGAETDIRNCTARRNCGDCQCNDHEAAGVSCDTTEVCVVPVYAGSHNLGPWEDKADDTTPSNCIKLCKEKNKKLAGVFGKRCSCGNGLSNTDPLTCDRVCPSDSSKICGGKWAISVFSTIPPGGCCFSILVTSGRSLGQDVSGVYTWSGELKNYRLVYVKGADCLLFAGHWKVEKCDHHDLEGAVGLIKAPDSNLGNCPEDVGKRWTYYADSDGDGGDITVECGGCCPSLLVTSGPSLGQDISGVYTWSGELKNYRPVYRKGDYCLLYAGHWKVEKCNHGDLKGAVGLIKAPASSLETCPMDVQKWTYYADSDGDGGDVTVECLASGVTYLHFDSDYVYYKVEVATDKKMMEGATTTTCRQVKMQAVCEGQRGCRWIDETKCVVTPLQNSCEEPMKNLSKAICDGETDPKKCDKLEGVFQYVQGWSGGDQGLVGGKSVKGKDHISGDGDKKLFAYCAKPRAK